MFSAHPDQKPSDPQWIWKHIIICEERILEMEKRIIILEHEIENLKK